MKTHLDTVRPGRQPWASLTAVYLCAAALYTAFVLRAAFRYAGRDVFTLFDDSMISMQYARNLAAGHGLVWNAGGPRVEGYSNLLWVLVMSAVHLLRLPDERMAFVVAVIGLLILVMTIHVTATIAMRLQQPLDGRAGVYAAILTATCYPVMYWTLRGMEVGLLALAVTGLAAAFTSSTSRASRTVLALISIVCLALTRDDGLVPAVAVCAVAIAFADSGTRRIALLSTAVLGVAVVSHLLWRHSYYGEWVPNTYYLKLTGVPASWRLSRGALSLIGVMVMQFGPLLVPAVLELRERSDWRYLSCLSPIAAVCAYSVYVGGDGWEFLNFANRYISPALPLLCVCAALYLCRLQKTHASIRTFVVAIAGVMLLGAAWDTAVKVQLSFFAARLLLWAVVNAAGAMVLLWRGERLLLTTASVTRVGVGPLLLLLLLGVSEGRPFVQWVLSNAQVADNDRQVAIAGFIVGQHTTPPASIAVFQAGSTVYFSRRTAIDLLGKNDTHVAKLAASTFYPGHNKEDLDYSLAMEPVVVVTLSEATGDLRAALDRHGYARSCVAFWVRRDSTSVDAASLAAGCAALK